MCKCRQWQGRSSRRRRVCAQRFYLLCVRTLSLLFVMRCKMFIGFFLFFVVVDFLLLLLLLRSFVLFSRATFTFVRVCLWPVRNMFRCRFFFSFFFSSSKFIQCEPTITMIFSFFSVSWNMKTFSNRFWSTANERWTNPIFSSIEIDSNELHCFRWCVCIQCNVFGVARVMWHKGQTQQNNRSIDRHIARQSTTANTNETKHKTDNATRRQLLQVHGILQCTSRNFQWHVEIAIAEQLSAQQNEMEKKKSCFDCVSAIDKMKCRQNEFNDSFCFFVASLLFFVRRLQHLIESHSCIEWTECKICEFILRCPSSTSLQCAE